MTDYDLLIVGNGFDIACGYKTSYQDFYELMKAASEKEEQEFYAYFEKENSNIELETAKSRGLSIFYNEINSTLKSNIFINYFLAYNTVFESWVAFETELTNIINAFDNFFEALKKYTPKTSVYDFTYSVTPNSIDDIVFSLIKRCAFFSQEDCKPHSHTFCFYINDLHNIRGVLWVNKVNNYISVFCDYIYTELNKFSNLFSTYLNIITAIEPTKTASQFGFRVAKTICFNYTKTCELVFKTSGTSLCYLNGKINYRNNLTELLISNIIFGTNEASFKNKGLDKLTKSSQRLLKETDYNNLAEILTNAEKEWYENTWNEKISICIYGHSLSIADKDTLQMVLNKFKKLSIYIYYLNDKAKEELVANLKVILTPKKVSELNSSNCLKFIKC